MGGRDGREYRTFDCHVFLPLSPHSIIEITSEVTGTAPIPILNVGVRQNGQLVGGQINVRPGTPLTMKVSERLPAPRPLTDAAQRTTNPIYALLLLVSEPARELLARRFIYFAPRG